MRRVAAYRKLRKRNTLYCIRLCTLSLSMPNWLSCPSLDQLRVPRPDGRRHDELLRAWVGLVCVAVLCQFRPIINGQAAFCEDTALNNNYRNAELIVPAIIIENFKVFVCNQDKESSYESTVSSLFSLSETNSTWAIFGTSFPNLFIIFFMRVR